MVTKLPYYCEYYQPDGIVAEGYQWFASLSAGLSWLEKERQDDERRISRVVFFGCITLDEEIMLSQYQLVRT